MSPFRMTIVVIILVISSCVTSKQSLCYIPAYLSISWTDSPTTYKVNISADAAGNVHTLTRVFRQIAKPIVNFKAVAKDVYQKRSITLYNITAPSCQISARLNKIPMIKQAYQALTKNTNFTFICPMKPGDYFMENVNFGDHNSVLAFLYRPNVHYAFTGGVYEEAKNKSLLTLMTFNILGKIARKSC